MENSTTFRARRVNEYLPPAAERKRSTSLEESEPKKMLFSCCDRCRFGDKKASPLSTTHCTDPHSSFSVTNNSSLWSPVFTHTQFSSFCSLACFHSFIHCTVLLNGKRINQIAPRSCTFTIKNSPRFSSVFLQLTQSILIIINIKTQLFLHAQITIHRSSFGWHFKNAFQRNNTHSFSCFHVFNFFYQTNLIRFSLIPK